MRYAKVLPLQSYRWRDLSFFITAYLVLLVISGARSVLPNQMWIDLPLHTAQVVVGSVLIIVAPGVLLLKALGLVSERISTCALLVGALSIVCWAVVFLALYLVSTVTVIPVLTQPVLLCSLGLLLGGLEYLAKSRSKSTSININQWITFSPALGLAIVAIFVSIAGSHLRTVGYPVGSTVLLLAICIVAVVPLALILDNPAESTAIVTIYLAALALIFHMAFISDYLWGWDVNQTFYLVSHIVETGSWDPDFFHRRTPLISVIATPVMLRQILGLDLNWVFKIYVPLLYALIPIAVYSLSRLYLSPRLSILPPFVLMFYQRFFNTIQVKQHFGELFLVSLVVVLIAEDFDNSKVLLVLFGFGLVTSHYVSAFLFIGMAGLYLIATFVFDSTRLPSVTRPGVSFSFAALVGILFAYWYMTVAQGYIFRQFVEIPTAIIIERLTASAEPVQQRTGQSLITQTLQMGVLRQLYFAIFATILGLLGTGVLATARRFISRDISDRHQAHLILCIPIFGMFAASIFVYGHFGIDRAIPLVFTVAAPFVLVGAVALARGLSTVFDRQIDPGAAVAVILAAFVLFNAGGVHYALNVDDSIEPSPSPQSFALEPEKNWAVFNDQEISGALWYVNHSNEDRLTFAGNFGYISLQRYQNRYTTNTSKFYERYANVSGVDLYIRNMKSDVCGELRYEHGCLDRAQTGNKIYENGRSKAYQKK